MFFTFFYYFWFYRTCHVKLLKKTSWKPDKPSILVFDSFIVINFLAKSGLVRVWAIFTTLSSVEPIFSIQSTTRYNLQSMVVWEKSGKTWARSSILKSTVPWMNREVLIFLFLILRTITESIGKILENTQKIPRKFL